MDIALYSQDLIRQLREDNPIRLPSIEESERMIFFEAGKQKLIQALEESLSQQIEAEKETPHVLT